MNRKMLVVLISSLLAAPALAGPPGDNTHGSTTTTLTESILGADSCMMGSPVAAADSDSTISSHAFAQAMSNAMSYVDVSYSGDVSVDITRHGNNGAVHQVALNTSMGSGTLFVQVSSASADIDSDASLYTNAEAQAAAEMIGTAIARLTLGIDESGDFLGVEITVKALAIAEIEASAASQASSESYASASSDVETDGSSQSVSSATGGGVSGSGSSFYVQGANIEQFQTQLSASSGSVVDVQTTALAEVYTSAMVTSMVYAMAESSAQALSRGELRFEYDLPLIGSGSLPIVTDEDSAEDAAEEIVNVAEAITAYAQAMASSSAQTMAGSNVTMNVAVQYENLPGTEDLLEITGTGNLVLDCSNASSSATANADAETN